MMPESRPASTASCRNTELSTLRAAGFSPNDTLRDAEGGVDAGVLRGDLADRVDRLDRVAPRLLLPGRDREGEAVDDDVVDLHAPFADEGVDQPRGDAHLVVAGARLALLVDRERDHGRAVLLDERHDAPEAAGRALAVFEVDRVDDRVGRR